MGTLLAADESATVEVREGGGPFVFVCEHASNRLPRSLGTLGLPAAELERHIAWDPGAAAVAAGLADRLDGDLVLQGYSRLIVDCNRDHDMSDAIPVRSEDTEIPHNAGLDPTVRENRIRTFWAPFHAALDRVLEMRRAARRPTVLVTIHTFTPVFRGVSRPWHVGIISTRDRRMADPLLAALRSERGLVVGDNEPYSPKDNVDFTIRRHGLERGLPHVMIEIRNDLVRVAKDVAAWIDRLAVMLREGGEPIGLAVAKTG